MHSGGAAQLLSLCLNGPLMTTTFCSTRLAGGGSGGWLRRGDGGHPTHKAETAMSEETLDGGGEVEEMEVDGGKVPRERWTTEGWKRAASAPADDVSPRRPFLRPDGFMKDVRPPAESPHGSAVRKAGMQTGCGSRRQRRAGRAEEPPSRKETQGGRMPMGTRGDRWSGGAIRSHGGGG